MRHSSDNFLYAVKQIVTGTNADSIPSSGTSRSNDGGIKVDVPVGLNAIINATATITTATTGGDASISVLQTAAAGTTIGHLSSFIPRDYDEASDVLTIGFAVQLANADASITLTGTPTRKPFGGVAVAGTLVSATLPFSAVTVNLTQTEQFVELTFKGLGLKRNDVVDVVLAYTGTLSGVANIYGIFLSYDSTIVSYNETDATDAPGGTLPGFGNPLR